MSEMIERVAKAIFEARPRDYQRDYHALYRASAKAAITAMREPTPEMLAAGMEESDCTASDMVLAWQTVQGLLEAEWRVMIDAALEERKDVAK